MKQLFIAVFVSSLGIGSAVHAQSGTPSSETTGNTHTGTTQTQGVDDSARPAAGATETTLSQGQAGSPATSDISGPRDDSSGSSGDSGNSGSSASGGEESGALGSSSAKPNWQGIGSTGGATGTGATIGTTESTGPSGSNAGDGDR